MVITFFFPTFLHYLVFKEAGTIHLSSQVYSREIVACQSTCSQRYMVQQVYVPAMKISSLYFSFECLLKVTYFLTGSIGLITDSSLLEFVDNCPNLISLSLLCFMLKGAILQKLIKVWLPQFCCYFFSFHLVSSNTFYKTDIIL